MIRVTTKVTSRVLQHMKYRLDMEKVSHHPLCMASLCKNSREIMRDHAVGIINNEKFMKTRTSEKNEHGISYDCLLHDDFV